MAEKGRELRELKDSLFALTKEKEKLEGVRAFVFIFCRPLFASLKMQLFCLLVVLFSGSGLGLTYLSNWASSASESLFSIQLPWTTERDA